MIEYYAIRGRSEEDQLWRTFIALKATDRKEATEFLDQWLKSHLKGREYTAFKVDDIRAWEFGNFSRQEGCRAFVSASAREITKKTPTKKTPTKTVTCSRKSDDSSCPCPGCQETRQQMLQGAP